ncbi:hypothetical protein GOP47_0029593 [Adiantum capillus-veneris]|nr:hypothetical protein GOP47_0029593 [Adiantum capillus-veneris]
MNACRWWHKLGAPHTPHRVSQQSVWVDGCQRQSQAYKAARREEISDFMASLRACARNNDLSRGAKLHDHILQRGLLGECSDALVSMYARCGALAKATELFDMNRCRDVLTWTALVAGHAQKGQGQDALLYFEQMQQKGLSPNAVTFSCALKACGSLRAAKKGESIHEEIAKQGLLQDNVKLGTALVGMYAKCGALAKARQVLNKLPVRDAIAWNTIISGYADHQEGEQALDCYEQMLREGLSADAVTFASILKACGSIRALDRGERIYDEICRQGCFQNDIVIGNALVDMYAKSGALVKARKVLEDLPTRNVLSWNALIAGYAEHGQDEQAWIFFEQMQSEDLSPTAATFHCILKVCGSMGEVHRGESIHDEMAKQGLLKNNYKLCTALVNMYAKCGAFEKAQRVFEELPARDVFSWNALIAGYAEHGKGEQALKCYELMQRDGVFPDVVTFACALKACGNVKAVAKGEKIHDEVAKSGWLCQNLALGNALVGMYAKCGVLVKARQVLEELPMRNVVSWNALIAGYVEHGEGDKALKCFEQLLGEGLGPDPVTFACTLRACGSIKAVDKGEEIHHKIAELGLLENDLALGSALVYMYAMCGALERALSVFKELPNRNVVTWNALIVGYVEHGENDEALRCFERMETEGFCPDAVTYGCILKVCGTIRAINKGQQVHDEIAKQGLLGSDIVLGNALVDMYAKCGAFTKARQVLEELPVRNLITWNTLITGYVEHGKGEQALDCFGQMQREGHFPDMVTFTCLLKACGNIGALGKGQKIHDEIAKQGLLESNLVLGTALVDMYSSCGALAKARRVLDELPTRNVITWNALIAGFIEHDKVEEALACFEQLQCDSLSPDTVTYNIILRGCGNVVAAGMGEKIHDRISRQGLLKKDTVLGTALLHMYVQCGDLTKARQVLEEIPVQDVASWNALIGGLNKQGDCGQALKSFEQMQEKGHSPDASTFSSVLSACGRLGLVEEAEQHFTNMSMRYGLEPDIEHFTCIVDGFGRAGHLDKAIGVIERMPAVDSGVLLALLSACLKWEDAETGRWVFERAVQEDKIDAAMYAIMEKTYLAASMQEDAEKIGAMRIGNTPIGIDPLV